MSFRQSSHQRKLFFAAFSFNNGLMIKEETIFFLGGFFSQLSAELMFSCWFINWFSQISWENVDNIFGEFFSSSYFQCLSCLPFFCRALPELTGKARRTTRRRASTRPQSSKQEEKRRGRRRWRRRRWRRRRWRSRRMTSRRRSSTFYTDFRKREEWDMCDKERRVFSLQQFL